MLQHVGMFMVCLHMPSSCGLSAIATEPKADKNVQMFAMLSE
jgi:hypothetical protein